MNSKSVNQPRKESDRHDAKRWYSAILARPEVGPVGVMLLLFGMLGYFSIPSGEFSLNPFSGEGFNALAIRNNLRVISQLGIVALGAGLLIISGDFDLSIGSMIGFAAAWAAGNSGRLPIHVVPARPFTKSANPRVSRKFAVRST